MKNFDFEGLGYSFIYLVACFVLFFIGKLVYRLFHKKTNVSHQLLEKDNLAFSFSLVGYYAGLTLAIGSALVGEHVDILSDLKAIGMYGVGAIILLNIASIINDKIILSKFNLRKEINEDENVGTGIIEAANYIAVGLIIFGASSGGNEYYIILMYWFVAQVALIISSIVYNLITSYNIHDEIEKDNVAVGVAFAGTVVAISIIMSYAVSIEYKDVMEASISIGTLFVVGLILLPVTRVVIDKLLLPGFKLTDEMVNQEVPNIGCGLIEAVSYIGAAILITWCF